MTVNLAILGAGRIGVVHAGAVAANKNANIIAVADAFEQPARQLADSIGCSVMDIDAIAASNEVDGVIICTPTTTHADLIEKFAHQGKAVFCEKPIDLDVSRASDCVDVINETGIKFMLGFNRRFDPHFRAVRKAIDDGAIGDVEMVQITSRDPGAPDAGYIKTSGGIFKDMTIHDFDMARFLLAEEPDSVYATASVLTDPQIAELGDYDSASVILTTASGQQATISNSRRATYGYDQRIEVHGSGGMVQAENQRPVSIEIAGADGFTRPPLHDFFMTRYTQAYADEMAEFVDGMLNGRNLSPNATDGLKALALAEAAMQSVKSGAKVSL